MAHQGPRGPRVDISKAMIKAGSEVVRRMRSSEYGPTKIAEDVYRAMEQYRIENETDIVVTASKAADTTART